MFLINPNTMKATLDIQLYHKLCCVAYKTVKYDIEVLIN